MDNKKNIPVHVKNRVAWSEWTGFIVCGNGDYSITFTFDEEWGEDTAKTAVFKYRTDEGMKHTKQPFIGNTVAVPELHNIREVEVGVRFGDIATTTGASLRCVPSVLCDSGDESEYEKERFDEMMQLFNDMLHGHENLKTLADFYCLASELQNDNGPTILPDVVGVDRVSFRGNKLRYCGDGKVITGVTTTATEVRIHLSPTESGLENEDIVIPLADLTEVWEAISEIKGGVDEIEAMIDESGVLTE